MQQDVNLPETDAKDLSIEERDLIVGNVYRYLNYFILLNLNFNCFRKLMEIDSRLLPCGLHVIGEPPTAQEAIATLVNIAEIDRPDSDPPVRGLPSILASAINRNIEEIYSNNNKGLLFLNLNSLIFYIRHFRRSYIIRQN